MELSVSEDIDAPAAAVWDRVTDFSMAEDMAKGRGVELSRAGNWTQAAQGVEWRGKVTVRGKTRKITSRISHFAPEDTLVVDSTIGGMRTVYTVILVPLAPEVTRATATLEVSATTLTARLILQTMKLARGRLADRLQGLLRRQGKAARAAHEKAMRSA
jgi:hypothetical protein